MGNPLPAPQSGGLLIPLTSADGPGFDWKQNNPNTQNLWANTFGGYSFREFIVAVSLTSLNTYLPLNVVSWSVAVVGYNIGAQWADSGSSVTGDGNLLPIGSKSPQVQVLGLSFRFGGTVRYQ
jgi:hypothetical protein